MGMKHTKKKKRSRPQKQVAKPPNPVPRGNDDVLDEENLVLSNLMEVFASVSLQEAASAYREADGDPNKAAEILGNMVDSAEDQSTTCSSSNFSTGGFSSSSGNMEKFGGVCSKPKKVIAATGMVSTVLGKDYLSSKTRREVPKVEWSSDDPVIKGDAEQFLCSMMGDGCDLSMAVVRDVLCQCGYDVEKALIVLLELSASPSELSKSDQDSDSIRNRKEDAPVSESSDSLTDRASDSTSHSSESELQDSIWSVGYNGRSYSEVLTGSGEQPSSGPTRSSASELPQEVLKSLFNTPKSCERAPNSMNWRNVVMKMESFGQRLDFSPGDEVEQQFDHAKGEDYHVLRESARQHWDSMKSYYQKAATAYTNGEREYASYLSDQGRLSSKLARQADEKASQNVFKSRNKSIENMITIDLHGQHVKQAMRLLKLHLIFGAFVHSVRLFRVITGCGSHGLGKSKLKQSVVDLIEREGIEWREENRGTLLIKLNGQTEFSFLDSESDTEYQMPGLNIGYSGHSGHPFRPAKEEEHLGPFSPPR